MQPLVNISIWGDYLLNQEYIKEFLCINKEKPKLSCNGKCYLMLQLEDQKSEQEKEFPQFVLRKYEFVFFSFRESVNHQIEISDKQDNFSSHKDFYRMQKSWDIFHPPRV
ncbi:hypothetical protein DCS32_15600 [Dokdonia sp. Dokd-P16]|uniref:hypothetical protein n=1 Tax=Dokdonia sp. Dokd-P16 TaxID=2173169 RepID=UPI000D5489EE|nr:hypothetical protein [Dokdonia sp. Dokd-P16]AWH75535.1 hypothetical protein DCS32_15600 [Dokdonia sp. Dokd-P16]